MRTLLKWPANRRILEGSQERVWDGRIFRVDALDNYTDDKRDIRQVAILIMTADKVQERETSERVRTRELRLFERVLVHWFSHIFHM